MMVALLVLLAVVLLVLGCPGASAVAAVFVALALVTHYPGPRTTSSNDSDIVAKIDPQDYEVVADLDELIAWDENSVWEDRPTL